MQYLKIICKRPLELFKLSPREGTVVFSIVDFFRVLPFTIYTQQQLIAEQSHAEYST